MVVVLVATPRLFRCHQCLCFQSFTTHPPRFTTQSQSLSSSCPCAHSFCHSLTHSQATPPHTHTHAWWLVHFGAWCVCVCPRCWLWPRLARHSHVHPLLVPHTTPLLLLLLLLLVVDVVVAAWVLWRVWPLGPLTGCAGAVHSRFTHTHTHGVMGTWWWWLCVWCGCHHHCAPFPPTTTTVCAAPPCPLCVCVSGGTTHSRPLWCHPRWCECVSERRGHHTHHPRCRPMCPLSPLTRHATPATLSQMPRLTSLTHMACFVWLLPSTHTHTHWLADCPHALHTPPPLGVRVLIHLLSSATHTHTHTGRTGVAHAWVVAGVVTTTTPLVPHHHTHTQRDWWCGPWWCLVVRVCPVCASHATITLAFPPTTTTNALVPPPPSLTHGTWCMHHCHTHTPHAPPHTPRRAVC